MRYGYFDDDNREYVIERPDIPVSWTNYLGVRDFCTVISHNAGGYSFYKTPEHHRITRFRPNGVPLDRPGHYVYLRDDDSGEFWTISWQPVGKDFTRARYTCRHGLSYSKFQCRYQGIDAEQLLFVPLEDDVELWDVRLRNLTDRPRRLSIFSYVEFSFHHIEIDNQNLQMSLYAAGSSYEDGIIEYDFFYEPWMYHFFTASFEADSHDCVRDAFIGAYRDESNPLGVENGQLKNSSALGGNHCGALHKKIRLAPGAESRLSFILGVGSRRESGRAMRKKYSDSREVDAAFRRLKAYWDEKLSIQQCRTPHPGLNSMINTWTLYQAETCVVWSRFASFIEVGGRVGLGFRDTSQDVMGVVHSHPQKTKQRLRQLLNGLTREGYGLHLFDPAVFEPETRKLPQIKLPTVVPTPSADEIIHGLEDVCADDALWLVGAVCSWVKEQGEMAFFEESLPYADGSRGSVYEHLKRILDFSGAHIGLNGICQGLRADWNDCLNLGGGESAMVSFMHHWALTLFIEAAEFLGQTEDAKHYRVMACKVKKACEAQLWDGRWYIRGFTRKGQKIGSAANREGKLFLNAQSWAVFSGVAREERATSCMDAVNEHLYSPYGLHLLWPAYSRPDDDIGYVTRVYKGIKENASIFSHPNPWAIIAECMLGRGGRAMKFYNAILPYNQNDQIEIREAEPYSYCQFIMGRDHQRHGQARHPWLTGSASWFYIAATQYILGLRPGYHGLTVDPCIPADWPGFEVTRKWRGATYHIRVVNPARVEKGVKSVRLNGRESGNPLPVQKAGTVNEVLVEMG